VPYVGSSQQSVPSVHKYIEYRYGYGNHEPDGRQAKTDSKSPLIFIIERLLALRYLKTGSRFLSVDQGMAFA
jgi:hypothetical protein